jgi:hypothetical protein
MFLLQGGSTRQEESTLLSPRAIDDGLAYRIPPFEFFMGVFSIVEHVSPRNLNRQRSIDHCAKNVGSPLSDRFLVLEMIGKSRPRQKERPSLAQFNWIDVLYSTSDTAKADYQPLQPRGSQAVAECRLSNRIEDDVNAAPFRCVPHLIRKKSIFVEKGSGSAT